jgi:hypothetical protein
MIFIKRVVAKRCKKGEENRFEKLKIKTIEKKD